MHTDTCNKHILRQILKMLHGQLAKLLRNLNYGFEILTQVKV